MEMLVSIIVPVYNSGQFVRECVESILNQDYRRIECILVNDGSIDDSGDICDSLSVVDERVKVIHKTNGGAASARNVGIDAANGDYIMFVDSDDFIEPDMIRTLLDLSIKYDASIIGSKLSRFSKEAKISHNCSGAVEVYSSETILNRLLTNNIDSSPCTKLFKSSLLNKLRFVEGRTNEDFVFLFSLYNQVSSVIYLDKVFYHYRNNPQSVTNTFGPHFYDQYYNMLDLEANIDDYSNNIILSFNCYKFMLSINVAFYTLINHAKINNKKVYDSCRNYLINNWTKIFSKDVFSIKYLIKLIVVILVF